jgi:hypothetical protein
MALNEPWQIALLVLADLLYVALGVEVVRRYEKLRPGLSSINWWYVRVQVYLFMVLIWPLLAVGMMLERKYRKNPQSKGSMSVDRDERTED